METDACCPSAILATACAAEKSKVDLATSGRFKNPIVTAIREASTFWPAEEYHQDYLKKNPNGYCHIKL